MGAGTALRLARTALFAVVCVAVSGLGHALMSGGPLPLLPLAAVLVPVAGAGWWLARRERGAPVTVAAHVLGQLGLHAYFAVTGAHSSADSATGVPTAAAEHVHHAHELPHVPAPHPVPDTSLLTELLGAFGSSVFTGPMAAAHALAGLVCGWWLWRGEVALARLGRSLALFVRAPLRTAWRLWSAAPPAPGRPVRPRGGGRCRRPQGLLAPHVLSRRGPPLPVPSL
ncbi:integral membrane protein [Streptomyces sp. CFMR 7]|nr:integral membrane protein [Streptomyces sp. CFMR 7]